MRDDTILSWSGAGRRFPLGSEASAGGFVLAGGRSTRMGRDKALLETGGTTLLARAAEVVRAATGRVVIIADPSRYARFGYVVVPDRRSGLGPLAGVATALAITEHDWNLVLAVDMPNLDPAGLRALLYAAVRMPDGCECVAPLGPTGPEPLCAVYHRKALAKIQDALDHNILRMRTVLELLQTHAPAAPIPLELHNVNTPEEWAAHG